jgi:hypothetical protein
MRRTIRKRPRESRRNSVVAEFGVNEIFCRPAGMQHHSATSGMVWVNVATRKLVQNNPFSDVS